MCVISKYVMGKGKSFKTSMDKGPAPMKMQMSCKEMEIGKKTLNKIFIQLFH